jgi:hypothetical protein
MFPSGNQPRARGADAETGDDASDDAIDAVEADGAGGLPDDDSIPPDDDPSSVP